jgi:hypothetical protein
MRRRSTGYLVGTDTVSGKVVDERDSFTCSHCGAVFWMAPGQSAADTGGYCRACDSYVCPKCAGGDCNVFMKKLERAFARAALVSAAREA